MSLRFFVAAIALVPAASRAQDAADDHIASPDHGARRAALGATERITPRAGQRVSRRTYINSYRLLDDRDGVGSGAHYEQLRATVLRGGFRLGGDVHDIVIRDVDLTLAAPTKAPELPAGIEVQGTAHDILIENATATGFRMVYRDKRYTNGDGFSSERGVSRLTIRHSTARDNSDGGFDLKSSNTRLEDLVSVGNGYGYRLWGSGEATWIESRDPRKAHLQMNTEADWHIATFVARSTGRAPIFAIPGNATLTIDRCELDVPADTPLISKAQDARPTLHLGPGCDRTVSGARLSQR